MKEIYEKIWNIALPHQDKRSDEGHAKVTVRESQKLLKVIGANPDVVIPAATLHDIGWDLMSKDEISYDKISDDAPKDEVLRRRLEHQEKGAKRAREILEKLGYSPDLIEQIVEIISEHDTRKGTISIEDSIVRDADKLWRFSNEGFWIAIRNLKMPPKKEYTKLERQIDEEGFFFTEEAREIARKELEERKKEAANWVPSST